MDAPCKCGEPARVRGMCRPCYQALYRQQTRFIKPPAKLPKSPIMLGISLESWRSELNHAHDCYARCVSVSGRIAWRRRVVELIRDIAAGEQAAQENNERGVIK